MRSPIFLVILSGLFLLVTVTFFSCCTCKKDGIDGGNQEGLNSSNANKEATLLIHTKQQQTDYVDQNGNPPAPTISPIDTIVVRSGVEVFGFLVKSVTPEYVDIESKYMRYYCSETQETSQKFRLNRGQSYSLMLADLLDASHTTYIEVK